MIQMPNVCLTGWLQPVLDKERLRIASPVFKLLLCAAMKLVTPAAWVTTK